MTSEWFAIRAAGVAMKDLYWAVYDLRVGEVQQEDIDYIMNRIVQIEAVLDVHIEPDAMKRIGNMVRSKTEPDRLTDEERRLLCRFHGRSPQSLRRAKRDFDRFYEEHPEYKTW